jgi:teichuronic acid exporter
MSIERDAVAGLKWTGLSKLTSQLINWGIILVVLRLPAPSDYGLMAILSVFIGLLTNVAELGLGASLVQARDLSRQEIVNVAGLAIVANAAAFLCLALAAPLIARFYSEPRLTLLTQVAALQFLFNALATVPQALAYREMV